MKFKANLKDLINKFTNDQGELDEDGAVLELNTQIEKFNSKNQPKVEVLKEKAYEEAKTDFIKGLGVEGVEDETTLTAYLNRMASDNLQVENQKLSTNYTDLEKKYAELESQHTKNSTILRDYKNEKFLMSKKAKHEDVEYLNFKINKLAEGYVSEEVDYNAAYEKATQEFAESNPKYFNVENTPVNQVKTTGRPMVIPKTEQLTGWEKILVDKGKLKK